MSSYLSTLLFDAYTNISLRLICRYNGFCKGVLWPILHNVASVYSSPQTGNAEKPDADKDIEPYDSQYAEYSMDDVAQGPIHGDGGREGELWAAFTAVNRHFTDVIIQCFNEGDLIWIHGFHLMILPSFLTRRISMAKIGGPGRCFESCC